MDPRPLQDRFNSPVHQCFGCGSDNPHGLRLKSRPQEDGDGLIAEWTPEAHHQAFAGVLSGGIIGTLLDCHSNWTAWWALYRRDGIGEPFTVTSEYTVRLLRPTPLARPVHLAAYPTSVRARRVEVEATLESGGEKCAAATGVFVRPRT